MGMDSETSQFDAKAAIQLIEQLKLISPSDLSDLREIISQGKTPATEALHNLVAQQKLTSYQEKHILLGNSEKLLLGNYVILRKLGSGGMGDVFLAEHRRMDRKVALKILSEKLTNSREAVERFHREVKSVAMLSHPNIVTAYDADEHKGIHFFVMEYVEGKDLASLVRSQGTMPLELAIDCIYQAAKGLEYAHQHHVIHRDIKPHNLLLNTEGDIKILDMGLARIEEEEGASDDHLTQTGMVMGTFDFMSPEQAVNTRDADARSDVYSLGCTFHFLLSGKTMYGGKTYVEKIIAHREKPIPDITKVSESISEHVNSVYQKMVAKKPEDRYQSMEELITDLEQCRSEDSAMENVLAEDIALRDFLKQLHESGTSLGKRNTVSLVDTMSTANENAETIIQATTPTPFTRKKRKNQTSLYVTLGSLVAAVILIASLAMFRSSPKAIELYVQQPEAVGAIIYVDGVAQGSIKDVGKQLLEIANVDEVMLRVSKTGYEPFEKIIALPTDDGSVPLVELSLAKSATANNASNNDFAISLRSQNDSVECKSFEMNPQKPFTIEMWISLDKEEFMGPILQIGNTKTGWLGVTLVSRPEVSSRPYVVLIRNFELSSSDSKSYLIRELNFDYNSCTHIAVVFNGTDFAMFSGGYSTHPEVLIEHNHKPSGVNIERRLISPKEVLSLPQTTSINEIYLGFSSSTKTYDSGITIDDLRISQTARYDEFFNPVHPLSSDEDTLLLWNFNEGTGQRVRDLSGNQNTGLIQNGSWVKSPVAR